MKKQDQDAFSKHGCMVASLPWPLPCSAGCKTRATDLTPPSCGHRPPGSHNTPPLAFRLQMASSILPHQQTDRERAIMLNTKETVNSCFWSDNNHDNMTLRKNIFLELRIVRPIRTAKPNMRHALQTLSKHRPPWFVTSTHIKAKHATCGFKRFRRIAILNSKLSFRPSKRRPWCLSEPRDPPSSKHVLDYLVFSPCYESSNNGSEN